MAYRNLVLQACADKAEFFCQIRDFVCSLNGTYADYTSTGLGWTLVDAVYTTSEDAPVLNDYFVITSTGSSGKEKFFIKIQWSSTSYIAVTLYAYWDASAHSGYVGSSSINWNVPDGTVFELSVYGSEDTLNLIESLHGAIDYHVGFSLLENDFIGTDVLQLSSGASSGSSVVLSLDGAVPSHWKVNDIVYLWGAGQYVDRCQITNIGTNEITVASLSHNKAIGTCVALFPPYTLWTGTTFYCMSHVSTAWASFASATFTTYQAEPCNSVYLMFPLVIGSSSYGYGGKVKDVLFYSAALSTEKVIYTTKDGDEYRYFKLSTNYYAFPEV